MEQAAAQLAKEVPTLIDSHAHLDFEVFDEDRARVLERARERGVREIISIGTRPETSAAALKLAESDPLIFASAGLHPLSAHLYEDEAARAEAAAELAALMRAPRVVAVGETGLDYYYNPEHGEVQRRWFRWHLQESAASGRPIIVHIRDAFEDALRISAEEGLGSGGVVHCFTGGPEEAAAALELGYFISLSGIVTFKSAKALRRAVPEIPLDRLLVETDSPYLAPTPHRGSRNEPAFVVETAREVARLKGVSYEALCAATQENTRALFNLPHRAQS
ncbi:MAG: TatD family hydrolase [Myxococcota bacterium]|nr:TatD family hydrolase [Myxococcota bacterium]